MRKITNFFNTKDKKLKKKHYFVFFIQQYFGKYLITN